ncbi:hypothetical protein GA0070606_3815 [Micromonospora citrea]|uniref:Rho termination factor, N-terminal domain n=1 Tax=Micromonospora citrea TaxID=47855 RepID=A0A1C6VBC0_9ACTN|nr:hypothetical protein [Micromonospora citrea]SCL63555.1 hypothetical protein GA0070606_3815 [Micromonospora citrea]
MAQRNSSGRGGTATRTKRQAGNQTPNTPGISESEISRMKVDEIRGQLRRRGVSGISALRKPELVKTLARTLRAERPSGGAARRSTGPAGRATGAKASAGRAAATKKAATGRAAGKAAPSRAKAANKAAPAKKAPARKAAAKAAPAKKAAAARKAAPAARKTTATKTTASARTGSAGGGTATRSTPVRTGRSASRSVRSSQPITSVADRPERPGRSLVTTNHEVIRRWARERGAKPATIAGTEREGRAGVLTFNMPGYRESSRVREITWDEWFRTFDERKLNLIYQEQLRDGRPSNFFRTESPDREDA